MKTSFYQAILVLLLMVIPNNGFTQKNPLIRTSVNERIEFGTIEPARITAYSEYTENQVNRFIKNYYTEPFPVLNEKNVLYPLDSIYDLFSNASLYLLFQVHPDEKIRTLCSIEFDRLDSVSQAVFQNKTIYDRLTKLKNADDPSNFSASQKQAISKFLESFEHNGIHMEGEKKAEYQEISSELFTTEMMFMMNSHVLTDTFYTTKEMLTGMPASFLESHLSEDGKQFFIVPGPDYSEIMNYADNQEIRKQAYFMRRNFAYEANKDLLNRMIDLRMKKANILGYDNFTSYQLKNNMVENSSNLKHFLDDLTPEIKKLMDTHYHELIEFNHNQEINAWDISYLERKKLITDLDINLDELKQYFQAEKVIQGLMEVTGTLFDITYREIIDFSGWHKDVRLFEMYKNQELIGTLYLDLYAREGKATQGAMCGPIIPQLRRGCSRRLPQLVLVSSFPNSKPSLLSTTEVLTLFHEIGHGMHFLFQENEFMIQDALEVEWDFIEIPSTLFEIGVWEKDVLKHITEHIDTHKPLPDDLTNSLLLKINQDQITRAAGLLRDAYFDYNLHTYYDNWTDEQYNKMLEESWNMIYSYPYPATGKNPLTGDFMLGMSVYAANLYSYIWALVYARDILSVFGADGILNSEVGNRYRKEILAPGASKSANEILMNFLGRKPNEAPFFNAYVLE